MTPVFADTERSGSARNSKRAENAMNEEQTESPACGCRVDPLVGPPLDDLIEQWKHRARIADRDGSLESEDIGKAYLRAKFWAYYNCAIELANAIGKPIPMPDQLLTDQQISEILARHQTQPT